MWRRYSLTTGILLLAMLLMAEAPKLTRVHAWADGTHVVVSWRERGLWPQAVIHGMVRADAQATYVCVGGPRNGNSPPESRNISDRVRAEGEFSTGEETYVDVQVMLAAPDPLGFDCANGQRLELACVSFSRLNASDTINVLSSDVHSSFYMTRPGYSQYCGLTNIGE